MCLDCFFFISFLALPNSRVAKVPSAPANEGPALKMERPIEFAFKVQVFCEGKKTYHPVNLKSDLWSSQFFQKMNKNINFTIIPQFEFFSFVFWDMYLRLLSRFTDLY